MLRAKHYTVPRASSHRLGDLQLDNRRLRARIIELNKQLFEIRAHVRRLQYVVNQKR